MLSKNILEITSCILDYTEWNNRVPRRIVDMFFVAKINEMKTDCIISAEEWSAIYSINYGINWYIQTGRAPAEIEQKLSALTGLQYIKLIAKMYCSGIAVSGDVGRWLQENQNSYSKK